MKTTLLALLTVLALGCGGALEVPGEECVELEQIAPNSCGYALPSYSTCNPVRLIVDGVPAPAEGYEVACSFSVLILKRTTCEAHEVVICQK